MTSMSGTQVQDGRGVHEEGECKGGRASVRRGKWPARRNGRRRQRRNQDASVWVPGNKHIGENGGEIG
jgi:hypothetical protein